MRDLLICSGSNVLLAGLDEPTYATFVIDKSSGKIIEVSQGEHSRDELNLKDDDNVEWIDAGNKVVLPAMVDTHVHLNEPGRTDWEGFWTGTRAAASGGITTLVDMPLNSLPPTTTVLNLNEKRKAAMGQCYTDIAFWGGVIPGNHNHLIPLLQAGVPGFKCFLIESGVQEFPHVNEADLRLSMQELQNTGSVLLFHAEIGNLVHSGKLERPQSDYYTFLESRPQSLETTAISFVINLNRSYPNLRCHIVHLSAASAIPLIREAKNCGLKITVETCFHYLCLSAENILAGHAEFKCCPPVRQYSNRDKLWDGLKEGIIDFVVSDHSPCVLELKKPDIMSAWGGISSLGLGLSLLWTEGRERGVTVRQMSEWTSTRTAEHAGLGHSKGQIKVGYDADFIFWDPEVEFVVSNDLLQYKNKISPYEGMKLYGKIEQTYLRGCQIFDHLNGFKGLPPNGKILFVNNRINF